jgi:hypothetical protein
MLIVACKQFFDECQKWLSESLSTSYPAATRDLPRHALTPAFRSEKSRGKGRLP